MSPAERDEAARKLAEFDPVIRRAVALKASQTAPAASSDPSGPLRVKYGRQSKIEVKSRKADILAMLARKPMFAPDIAGAMHVDPQLISSHLSQLRKMQFIEHAGTVRRGLARLWTITEAGKLALAQGLPS